MKKLIITVLSAVLAMSTVSAQDFQPIGYAHNFSFGAGYGYASGQLSNYLTAFADFNFVPSYMTDGKYFRARLDFNFDQITEDASLSTAASFQYMQPIKGGFYVYPFVRIKGEFHNNSWWNKKADFAPGLGAGLEYQFTSNFGLFAQGAFEYLCADSKGRPTVQAGLVFAFGQGGSKTAKTSAPKTSASTANYAARTATDVNWAASVPFAVGSCEVGNSAKQRVLALVPYLLEHPSSIVEVRAYGDKNVETPDETLAAKRDQAVRNILIEAGVPEERIVEGTINAAQAVTSQPGSIAIVNIK